VGRFGITDKAVDGDAWDGIAALQDEAALAFQGQIRGRRRPAFKSLTAMERQPLRRAA
jgi:hypothetical protein